MASGSTNTKRKVKPVVFSQLDCTMGAGVGIAYPGFQAVGVIGVQSNLLTGTWFKVIPAAASDTGGTHYLALGEFNISDKSPVDPTSVAKKVTVSLDREVHARWYKNSSGDAVTSVLGYCYIEDDETVCATSTDNTFAGRVWAIDATKGVLVERLPNPPVTAALTGTVTLDQLAPGNAGEVLKTNHAADAVVSGGLCLAEADPAIEGYSYTTNDYAPTAAQVNAATGKVLTVTAPSANSTITLPTTDVQQGTILTLVRLSTAAYTVTIQEGATGLFVMSASKRAMAVCVYQGTGWGVVGTVAP